MIPIDSRDFINIMSLIIFGSILISAVLTIFAYALAINRRKARPQVKKTPPPSSPET